MTETPGGAKPAKPARPRKAASASASPRAAKTFRPSKTSRPSKAAGAPRTPGAGASARGRSARGPNGPLPPRLAWGTPLLFALLAPPLFMLIDMSLEQASGPAGFSLKRLGSWIAEDGFFTLKAVYLAGVLPAAFAGLLIARRDQRGGASPLFALALFVLFALPVAILFARNLFLFAPPPFGEAVLIALRVVVAVVISGFVCYAVSRWLIRERR